MLGSYVLTLNSSMSFLTRCTCAAAEPADCLNVESDDNEGRGVLPPPHLPHVSATSSSRSRLVQNHKYMYFVKFVGLAARSHNTHI